MLHFYIMSSLLEDSKALNRLYDDLVSFKITAEDILADEKVVSSTENSPVKVASKAKKSSAGKRVLELLKRLSSGIKMLKFEATLARATLVHQRILKQP